MNINNMQKKQTKNLMIYLVSLGIIFLLFIFLISVTLIGLSVKERCQMAQNRYQGDCVESLVRYLEDEENNFQSRNSAIWALGQLGDSRALPVLEKYYTGYEGGKSKINEQISQYELMKSIKLAKGGFNITSFFWRFGQGIN